MRAQHVRTPRRTVASRLIVWSLACALVGAQLLGAAHSALHAQGGTSVSTTVAAPDDRAPADGTQDWPLRHAPGSTDCVLWAAALGCDAAAGDEPPIVAATPSASSIVAADTSTWRAADIRAFEARGPPAA
jgi:hypothetical protein